MSAGYVERDAEQTRTSCAAAQITLGTITLAWVAIFCTDTILIARYRENRVFLTERRSNDSPVETVRQMLYDELDHDRDAAIDLASFPSAYIAR